MPGAPHEVRFATQISYQPDFGYDYANPLFCPTTGNLGVAISDPPFRYICPVTCPGQNICPPVPGEFSCPWRPRGAPHVAIDFSTYNGQSAPSGFALLDGGGFSPDLQTSSLESPDRRVASNDGVVGGVSSSGGSFVGPLEVRFTHPTGAIAFTMDLTDVGSGGAATIELFDTSGRSVRLYPIPATQNFFGVRGAAPLSKFILRPRAKMGVDALRVWYAHKDEVTAETSPARLRLFADQRLRLREDTPFYVYVADRNDPNFATSPILIGAYRGFLPAGIDLAQGRDIYLPDLPPGSLALMAFVDMAQDGRFSSGQDFASFELTGAGTMSPRSVFADGTAKGHLVDLTTQPLRLSRMPGSPPGFGQPLVGTAR